MLGSDLLPEQMICLAVEFLAVVGVGPEQLVPCIAGLSMVDVMLNPALAQYRQQLPQQSLSERSVRERYAVDCLRYMWRLGKQLLRVSRVAEADLEEEASGVQQQAAGEWADYRLVSSAQGGVTVELPAEVVEQLRLLWEHYSRAMYHAVELYQGTSCAWVLGLGEGIMSIECRAAPAANSDNGGTCSLV
jgi:hypothetical protein